MKLKEIKALETKLRRAMRIAKGKGWKIRRATTCDPYGRQCCAIGAAPAVTTGAYASVEQAADILGIDKREARDIANGFDAPREGGAQSALRKLGARLWAYSRRCRPLTPTARDSAQL